MNLNSDFAKRAVDRVAFEIAAKVQGADTVLERRWDPNQVVGEHTHPFGVVARIVQGELWLGCGDEQRHLRAGDVFSLPANTRHTERYGAEGAVFWAARWAVPS